MKTTINNLETLRTEISKLTSIDRAEIRDNEVRVYKNHECIIIIDSNLEIEERVEGISDVVEQIQSLIK